MNPKDNPRLMTIGLAIISFALGAALYQIFHALIQAPSDSKQRSQQQETTLIGPIKYNCELSAGTFKDGVCSCPLEMNQTQEQMYDRATGFCQSTIGGPAGNADAASSGLPYGDYGFWRGIILNLCTKSGGKISGVACICPSGKTYSKDTGACE